MTTIKEHIDAGHYPTDDKGRALVRSRSCGVVTIYATDCPEAVVRPEPICGYVPEFGVDTWSEDGVFRPGEQTGFDLLPPKVPS